ncbi:MAG: DEAD/DEAH box helicase, partial [Cyanobacteria bacterium J06553_1]
SGSGRWGVFVTANSKGRASSTHRQESEPRAAQPHESGLQAAQRHDAYSNLLSQLRLHPDDKTDLQRRGLSGESIAQFRSIKPWQKLVNRIDPKTPGASGKGSKLGSPYSGYLCPARDLEGQITGFQIRNRVAGDGPKYPWLSTASNPVKLPNGESPLTFAPGAGDSVYLAEGILKPAIAAEIHDVKFIGAAGGMFASSPKQFEAWVTQLQPAELILCPDGGAQDNSDVMREYAKLAKMADALGHSLKVSWWGQATKDDGDIDDIKPDVFERSQVISWTEYFKKCPADVIERLERQSLVLGKTQETEKEARNRKAYERVAKQFGIKPATLTGKSQTEVKELLYKAAGPKLGARLSGTHTVGFAEPMAINWAKRGLDAWDASKGTGKTSAALMAGLESAISKHHRALCIVPTRVLAANFAARVNAHFGKAIAKTHEQKWFAAPIVITCPESAYKFKNEEFGFVAIDEVNEVIERAQAGTLGQAPRESLAALGKLLSNAQHVSIATADMWAKSLQAVQRMGNFDVLNTRIQQRVRPSTAMNITTYSNQNQWMAQVVASVEAGKKTCIPMGAQEKGRDLDRILRQMFPKKKGLVIDAVSTLPGRLKSFKENPDKLIAALKPSWFIFSPIANSGVSIEGEYFDSQFEYITPGEGAQSASQRGERNRSAIGRDGKITDRHIFFSERGAATIESSPEALDPAHWEEVLSDEANAPLGAALKLAKDLGAERALTSIESELKTRAAQRPELPAFLAIKAYDCIFKRLILNDEWRSYGWDIAEANEPTADEKASMAIIKGLREQITIDVTKQSGRTLAKAKPRDEDTLCDEATNPMQAVRMRKAKLGGLVGHTFIEGQDSEWFTAWVADKSGHNPGINAVVRSRTLAMAINRPDEFAQLYRAKALKFLAPKADPKDGEVWALPSLPVPARTIDLAHIISQCPGIKQVLSGELKDWSNYSDIIIKARDYLAANARAIAANTRAIATTGKGYKFSAELKPAQAFKKALVLMGHETVKQRTTTGPRVHVHRLATLVDAEAAIQRLEALASKGKQVSPLAAFRAALRLHRAQTRTALDIQIDSFTLGAKFTQWMEDSAQAQALAEQQIIRRHTVFKEISNQKQCDGLIHPFGNAVRVAVPNAESDPAGYMAAIEYLDLHPEAIPISA